MDETYDVVVIGGGAAGLSGALALGRARRKVLVVDAGEPRNAAAGHVHNYLGREGAPPRELLATGRAEVATYGVEVVRGRVTSVTPGFVVALEDGTSVRARRVLVTTGVTDELPGVPGVREDWGHTVIHCPYCHGWEVRDQPLGVLGTSPLSAHQALMFSQWSNDVTLFQHTAPALTVDQREELDARGITVVEGTVASWGPDGVRLADGTAVARAALVVGAPATANAELLAPLGLDTVPMEMAGFVLGRYVPADPAGQTSVPGVYVAGNVAELRATVIVAAAAGLNVGAAINMDLTAEETSYAVERARVIGEAAWDKRYADKDAIWSGNPNVVLVTEVVGLAPGRALDVGAGEGADALWLAARGWAVTGVDISSVALARAAEEAERQGLKVDWQKVDLLSDPPAPASYDLVTAHFMHLPNPDRRRLYAALADAVVPGGTLLLVGHHPSQPPGGGHRPALLEMLFTPDDLVSELASGAWAVDVVEVRQRVARDPGNPSGPQITLADTVVRARRL